MLMVPQQHRLFSLAPDAPTVALGLNGSAIFIGAALGSALGGLMLTATGPFWLAPAGALVAAVAVVLARENAAAPARGPVPALP
jgi:predicted MFS family arabinose efflux permease